MDKVTRYLVIITAACLLLASCGLKPSATTLPISNEKSGNPTVESTPAEKPVNPPDVNGATISPTAEITQEKSLIITRDMNGKFFSLKVGEIFEIHLATIPMAGFEWTPQDPDTTILVQEGKAVYQAGTSPNSAGGIVTLRFRTVGAGNTHLTLLYLHPADKGLPALYNNSFGVNIEVK
jgi:predicted secreted protein